MTATFNGEKVVAFTQDIIDSTGFGRRSDSEIEYEASLADFSINFADFTKVEAQVPEGE